MTPGIVLCLCLVHTSWGLKHINEHVHLKHSAKFHRIANATRNTKNDQGVEVFVPAQFMGSLTGESDNTSVQDDSMEGSGENLVPGDSTGSSVGESIEDSVPRDYNNSLFEIPETLDPKSTVGPLLSEGKNNLVPKSTVGPSLSEGKNNSVPGGSVGTWIKESLKKLVPKGFSGSSFRESIKTLYKRGFNVEVMARAAVAGIFEAAGGILERGWDVVNRVEFPVKEKLMYFPNNMVAIVDEVKKSIWYIESKGGKYIGAAIAYGAYGILKVIGEGMGPILRELNIDCIAVEHSRRDLNYWSFNRIEVAAYTLCGLSNIKPINNVTIWDIKDHLKRTTLLLHIADLHTEIPSVNVTNMFVTPLYDAPVIVHINETIMEANFYISASGSPMLQQIRWGTNRFEGMTVKIDNEMLMKRHHSSSGTMANLFVTESSLWDVVKEEIKRTVTEELKEVQTKLAAYLTGLI